MKIGINTNNVAAIHNNNLKKISKAQGPNKAKDTVELSGVGKELSKYIEMAKGVEIKDSRVEEIRIVLQNKTYSVDSIRLARAIIEDLGEGYKQWI
jgi:anti-sigma28 factor (negative regulator of flagellin synthesis)